jgi:hypothetical protein
MNATRQAVVGVDTAKSVFQVYTVEQETGEGFCRVSKLRSRFLTRNHISSSWTDLSCQRIKLVCERNGCGAIDSKLAFANHVHELDTGKYTVGRAE